MTILPRASDEFPGRQTTCCPAVRHTRVLIVDPHPVARRGLRLFIQAEGGMSVCGEADDPHAAAAAVARERPDVVVLNVDGSRIDGCGLIRRLRRADAHAAIVAVSMSGSAGDARGAVRAGASAFVANAGSGDELIGALRRAGTVRPGSRAAQAALAGRVMAPSLAGALDELERQVLALTGTGLPAGAIAMRLRVPRTAIVEALRSMKIKLRVFSAVELVRSCHRIRAGSVGA